MQLCKQKSGNIAQTQKKDSLPDVIVKVWLVQFYKQWMEAGWRSQE